MRSTKEARQAEQRCKSAYKRLGVAEDATRVDIEIAFLRATERYSHDTHADLTKAAEDFEAVKTAYNILRDPDARAAHDRHLRAAQQPPIRIHYEERTSSIRRATLWCVSVVAAIAAAGYVAHAAETEAEKAAEAKAQLAREAQARREAELHTQQQRAEAERLRQEAEERRFAMESRLIADQAAKERERVEKSAVIAQQQDAYEQRYKEMQARAAEAREVAEARLRTEQDKRRIRDACYQLYGRGDC